MRDQEFTKDSTSQRVVRVCEWVNRLILSILLPTLLKLVSPLTRLLLNRFVLMSFFVWFPSHLVQSLLIFPLALAPAHESLHIESWHVSWSRLPPVSSDLCMLSFGTTFLRDNIWSCRKAGSSRDASLRRLLIATGCCSIDYHLSRPHADTLTQSMLDLLFRLGFSGDNDLLPRLSFNNSICFTDWRYTVPLPWKSEKAKGAQSCLLNNYEHARKRLLSLNRRLARNPVLSTFPSSLCPMFTS